MSARTASLRLLLLVVVLAALPAQDRKQHVRQVDGQPVCTVVTLKTPGANRRGGQGYVLIDAVSNDGQAHRVSLRLWTPQGAEPFVELARVLEVGPGEQARAVLPLPCGRMDPGLEVVIDGDDRNSEWPTHRGETTAALIVTDRPDRTAESGALATAVLQIAGGGSPPAILPRLPGELPNDWALLSGFDLILVDGASKLSAEAMEVLRRYAFAGGRLVVGRADRLPPGPLATACAQLDVPGRIGLGRLAVVGQLTAEFADQVQPMFAGKLDAASGPAPAGFWSSLAIPGLGKPPVKVFLLVILAFAVLMGPVNMGWLRKRRRPLLALVTVPAIGLGTTALILGYGFFHDGFGIRGVQRSLSLLDQRSHEAASVAARTVFAGLAPDRLDLPAGTVLSAPRLVFGDDGHMDGGTLPSRTPTVLTTAWQGTARQRLRFRQVADDTLEVLTDTELRPAAGTPMFVRLPDGTWFHGTDGRLQRLAGNKVRPAWQRLAERLGELETDPDLEPSNWSTTGERQKSFANYVQQQFGGMLEPGSYLLLSDAAPWAPDHGLRATWHLTQHWVHGRFGEEDVVR
ncbi:MAG: hypothetical protein IPK26_06695 [Planctomycetes bacterium]|nr:hypothetical protein [Planctomycetota bacterium]